MASKKQSAINVLIIGGGNMGKAITQILSQNGWAGRVILAVKNRKQQQALANIFLPKVEVVVGSREYLATVQVIIVAVKPQNVPDLYPQLRGRISAETLVISIAAGIKLQSLQAGFEHQRIIRSMPNTPARIGQGVTVWLRSAEVTQEQLKLARQIFALWGKECEVQKEKLIDVATAVFGSGPAYVCQIVESVIDGAVMLGFPWSRVRELVIQTFKGALALAELAPEKHLAQLRDEVTSPGGTTVEALYVFDRRGLAACLKEGIKAAFDKAQLLGA
ncbi:MAG: pyrroline-5-carboxylate reductase [Patescibacteria group bacterium]